MEIQNTAKITANNFELFKEFNDVSRFRLLLNDGEYSNSFAMLATQVKLELGQDHVPMNSAVLAMTYSHGQQLLCNFFSTCSMMLLCSQLNHLVHDEALPQYTVIKVKKLVCNQMANQVLVS